MTTWGAANNDNANSMGTPAFEWRKFLISNLIQVTSGIYCGKEFSYQIHLRNLYFTDVITVGSHYVAVEYNTISNITQREECQSCDQTINTQKTPQNSPLRHDDVIKWKHFPRNWPFVRGIHRSPVNSPHKGQWRGALMFSLICVWINDWVNNGEAGDLRRYRAHYDVIVMIFLIIWGEDITRYREHSV